MAINKLNFAQWKQAQEYEGRLFQGAYHYSRLRFAARDAARHKLIQLGRQRYNELRKIAGLPVIKDWTIWPEQLMQKLPRPI